MFGDMQSDVCGGAAACSPRSEAEGRSIPEEGCRPPVQGTLSPSAPEPEPAPPVASVEEADQGGDQAAAGLGVGVPGRLTLAAEAGDHEGLAAAVLLDPGFAVAGADARLLPAAHRHLGGEIVD